MGCKGFELFPETTVVSRKVAGIVVSTLTVLFDSIFYDVLCAQNFSATPPLQSQIYNPAIIKYPISS